MTKIEVDAETLILERAWRLKERDDAYPDYGMPLPIWVFRKNAIEQLKEEKILPEDFVDEDSTAINI